MLPLPEQTPEPLRPWQRRQRNSNLAMVAVLLAYKFFIIYLFIESK